MSGLYSNRKEALRKQKPKLPEAGGLFHRSELRRLVAMLVAVIVIGAVSISTIVRRANRASEGADAVGQPEVPEVTDSVVVLPDIDVAALDALVADATPEQRVILDLPALDWAFDATRLLREPHYRALERRMLDAETVDALLADPPGFRAQAFRARGRLEDVRFYEAVGRRPAHFRAGLRLEDGGGAWIAVRDVPDSGFADGDFVRVDGLFVELFRDEVGAGWIEQPLIVGREAVASYPAIAPSGASPEELLAPVLDDTETEVTGLPFDPFWQLMALTDRLDETDVDWESAPLVTMDVINAIAADGAAWRGKAVRFPACEVLDCWAVDPGENPARIDALTEGWLGNWTWKGPTLVARFQSPAAFGRDIHRRDVATARGFFLKNLAYEAKDGSLGLAPFFVVHSAEIVPPAEKSDALRTVTLIVSASLLGLGGLVAALLVRDRRRSRELQADLVRRRRARREQRRRDESRPEDPVPEGS